MTLRRYVPEDAEVLYRCFGTDPEMSRYSGWNPYADSDMARETVQKMIGSYKDDHAYSWVMDLDDIVVGTIGAYDYDANRSWIEIGMSIERASWGQGFATEAVSVVLHYLTEHEKIKTVRAWCASDNIGSQKAMKKAGMKMVQSDRGALEINGQMYDKLIFEYAWQ
jgi:ribosomal-protein-alanine N-acetyltransferase